MPPSRCCWRSSRHSRVGCRRAERRRSIRRKPSRPNRQKAESPMMWDTAVRDLRHAARGLVRNASFTVVAVATLAIGIGATTAVFSVVDGVLLKPLPYPEPDRLVAVWHDAPGAPGLTAVAGGLQMSPSMVVTYQEESRSFEQIGLWTGQLMNVTGFAEPEQVQAVGVTGQTLPAFGVAPLLGRWLGPDDESLRSALVAMLSYGY